MRSAYVDCKATEQVVTKCTDPDPELSSRPAYVDCKAAEQLGLYRTLFGVFSSPVAGLKCGEKVMAIGERNGWAKVRAVRAGQDVEGYALESCLTYGEPPPLEQPTEGQPQSTEGQAPGPAGQPGDVRALHPAASPVRREACGVPERERGRVAPQPVESVVTVGSRATAGPRASAGPAPCRARCAAPSRAIDRRRSCRH